jgi:hypothetical protein
MQPRTPRSYALAVPTGDDPRKTLVPAQGTHDVRYLRYWVSEAKNKTFCLVDAPAADAANTVHREARVLVVDDVFEVQEGL